MTPVSAPVRQKDRIQIIDSVRGVALLGILMMNIPFFANPEQYDNLNVLNEYSGPNYYVWLVVNGLFGGTMRALFSMLFGAGAVLLLSRLEKRTLPITPADIYYRRLIFLFLFGLVNAFVFLWPGDILYAYAICGLFLYPFRNLKPRTLLIISLSIATLFFIKQSYFYYQQQNIRVHGQQAIALEKSGTVLNAEQLVAKNKWADFQKHNDPAELQKEAQKEKEQVVNHGYVGALDNLSGHSIQSERDHFYNNGFYDIMICIFLGMALFKWGVLTGKRSKSFYWRTLGITLPIGLLLAYIKCYTLITTRFDNSQMFGLHIQFTFVFRRLFLSMAFLSGLMLIYKYGILKSTLKALSAVGQMAFTNYLMQSIICAFLFYGFGLGLYGKLQRYEEYYVVGAIWIVQILFSNIWLKYYQFGPFEWLWRSMTYWKKQPMKRVASVQEEQAGDVIPAIA